MQSDSVKSGGTKSYLRIRWPKSSPKSENSAYRIIKSKKSAFRSSKSLTQQSLGYTAAVRGYSSTSSNRNRCVGLRIQPRCANAVATPLLGQITVVGRRGLGHKRPRRAAHPARVLRGYLSCESTQQAGVSHCAGLGCLV